MNVLPEVTACEDASEFAASRRDEPLVTIAQCEAVPEAVTVPSVTATVAS